jgi:hypothetical protein
MLIESKWTRTDLMQIWGQFMRKLFADQLGAKAHSITQSNRNVQMVKVGINYLFNWSSYRY